MGSPESLRQGQSFEVLTAPVLEIERRFIIKEPTPDYKMYAFARIIQGYTQEGMRFRRSATRDGSTTFTRTMKYGSGMVREEDEAQISEEEFNVAWNFTNGRRIQKTRYFIPHGNGAIIHLDIFHGALTGKIIAEVEFDSVEDASNFTAPDWFAYNKKGKIREVTTNKGYSNRHLSSFGWPKNNGQFPG